MELILLLICAVGIFLLISQGQRQKEEAGRSAALLEQLVWQGGSLPVSEAVRAHLVSGDKILAIKAYRSETGADLATAREAVELAERLIRFGPTGSRRSS